MKAATSLIASIFCMTLIFVSCRKSDTPASKNLSNLQLFHVSATAGAELREMVEYFKDQEPKFRFAETWLLRGQTPLWEQSFSDGTFSNRKQLNSSEPSFFIVPVKSSTGEIVSYIKYVKNNTAAKFQVVNKSDEVGRLKIAKDSAAKKKIRNHLAIFGYFEKQLNGVDTLPIAGTNLRVFDVRLQFRQSGTTKGKTTGTCWILETCYYYDSGGSSGGTDGGDGSGAGKLPVMLLVTDCS